MARSKIVGLLLLTCTLLAAVSICAQQDDTQASRKIISRVVPTYPEMAKMMNLRGTVKVEAVVLPNGTVKSTRVIGGHPVLVRAAESAVSKWRWTASPHETVEPIELRFNPD